jgi:hypothetical protein
VQVNTVLAPLNSARVASKSAHTPAMACSHRSSIFCLEYTTSILGDEHQLDMQVVHGGFDLAEK